MPDDIFVPTRNHLLSRYQNSEPLGKFCDALDNLYFKHAYDTIVRKHAIYDQYRHDLATADTFDPDREWTYSDTRGLPYPWPVWTGGIAAKYPNRDKWSQKRIYLHLIVDQMLALPYTLDNFQRFVTEVEKELHYYPETTPWVKVGFDTDAPGHRRNVLYIYTRKDAAPSGYNPDMYTDSWTVIEELCRRICPCNISVRRTKF